MLTPMLPPAALRPSAQPFSRSGKKNEMFAMLEAKFPPPRPAVAAAAAISQKGVSGRPTSRASAEAGIKIEQRAHDRPVPPAEARHREGVGEAHQRADQPRQRHQLEQLIGRVVEADLVEARGRHAPDQPDRKADVLGKDRPEEVAARDPLAGALPEGLVLGVPVGDPMLRRALVHAPTVEVRRSRPCNETAGSWSPDSEEQVVGSDRPPYGRVQVRW